MLIKKGEGLAEPSPQHQNNMKETDAVYSGNERNKFCQTKISLKGYVALVTWPPYNVRTKEYADHEDEPYAL